MPPRILIVEDQITLAKNLKHYIDRFGADVHIAADGEQALAMLDLFMPDAMVMDYGLPGMDGLTLYTELVRRAGRRIECIMITGNSDPGLMQTVHAKGIRHVVCKPFSFSELSALIRECLSAATMVKQAAISDESKEVV